MDHRIPPSPSSREETAEPQGVGTRSHEHLPPRLRPRSHSPHLCPRERDNVEWFTGATLIVGDGSAPIRNAVFGIENGKFTSVGAGENQTPPADARIVNLTGLTVIPTLIDAHQHIGLTDVRRGNHSQNNYTRENLIEHLERSAYHGVAATMSLGLEVDEALAFELREMVRADTARFLTSGRGIAASPPAPSKTTAWGFPAERTPRPRGGRR